MLRRGSEAGTMSRQPNARISGRVGRGILLLYRRLASSWQLLLGLPTTYLFLLGNVLLVSGILLLFVFPPLGIVVLIVGASLTVLSGFFGNQRA